ncbi:MAG: hypothetical protein WC615_11965 [Mucilaginibacter sp.]|jgi:hypothetical protein|uniref:hypothetical protein n=1 Tax=Mucilaginibacter sp. TaxID=1882438 RepID=UPI003569368F
MYKKLLLVLVMAISLSACKKSGKKTGCDPNQICTAQFVTIGIAFTDNEGKPTIVEEYSMKNLSTGKPVTRIPTDPIIDYVAGYVLVANDGIKSEFSSSGDDVEITAKSKATGQVKKVIVKVSGGCNCHVAKLSGPDTVKFD